MDVVQYNLDIKHTLGAPPAVDIYTCSQKMSCVVHLTHFLWTSLHPEVTVEPSSLRPFLGLVVKVTELDIIIVVMATAAVDTTGVFNGDFSLAVVMATDTMGVVSSATLFGVVTCLVALTASVVVGVVVGVVELVYNMINNRQQTCIISNNIAQQTIHNSLAQQTKHNNLAQQTIHNNLVQQTIHNNLEQQTIHNNLEQQTVHNKQNTTTLHNKQYTTTLYNKQYTTTLNNKQFTTT